MSKILEVCVDSYESAVIAIDNGANRLELCSSLIDGGLTPTPGLLHQVKSVASAKNIPIFCLIRCRPGNFVYTSEEMEIMKHDVQVLMKTGADGFVFGALTNLYEVDMRNCREIVLQASPLPVTFHRAFDFIAKPTIEIEVLIDLGFRRVLTSGKQKNAQLGVKLIKKLIDQVGGRIIVMPGCGITKQNIGYIIENSGATEFHGSFKKVKEEESDEEQNKIFEEVMGVEKKPTYITDKDHLCEILYILNNVQLNN